MDKQTLRPIGKFSQVRSHAKHLEKRLRPILFSAALLAAMNSYAQVYESTVDYELEPIPEIPAPQPENSVPLGSSQQFAEEKLDLPIKDGPFKPTWESIEQNYPGTPDWLRDAKFGIWIHFGPQSAGESGDWYARNLYKQGSTAYNNHVNKYGHPSKAGYKEVLRDWNPVKYDPKELIKIYNDAGARFLVVQGVHHDQFDMWDSKYQPWNSTKLGPKRDLLGEWETAARAANMHFGITFHHEYSWWWWQTAFQSDTSGSLAGVPYDGNLTLEDGKGQWWEGFDPRLLYGVNLREYEGVGSAANTDWSPPSAGIFKNHLSYAEWYAKWWTLRIMDAVDKYNPDFIYTDGTDQQPFSGYGTGTGYKCDAMQRAIANFYNQTYERRGKVDVFSIVKFRNKTNGTVNTQENTFPGNIKTDQPWITEVPVGDWFYGPNYNYTSAGTIRFLLEAVSRDGNFCVCIPQRPDGSLDEACIQMLKEIGEWMRINGEGIYGSRAWKVYGEGSNVLPTGRIGSSQANKTFTTSDFRFTVGKDDYLYVWCMTVPQPGTKLDVKSLGLSQNLLSSPVTSVELLGYDGDIEWVQDAEGLKIICPETMDFKTAVCFRIGPSTYNFSSLTDLISEAREMIETAEKNIGPSTGQYKEEYIEMLRSAVAEAEKIGEDEEYEVIRNGISTLQKAIDDFNEKGQIEGGILSFDSVQDITRQTLKEARNFSRSDEPTATGRWGLLAEPWVYNDAILNQENGTRGGYDNYNNSRSISIQKWDTSIPAIENGVIYQTTTLPAGDYKIKISVNECSGFAGGEVYLNVAQGEGLPATADVPTKALAYYDMSNTKTGNTETVCKFSLEEETTVSIGISATVGASATNRSMRIDKINLLKGLRDVSSTYLKNYQVIQRKDLSYSRFGTPTNWTVENFECQSSSEGLRNGIDHYSGYNALMMGFWGDRAQAVGDPSDAKLYQKVTLPAGEYAFTASYDTKYNMDKTYMFVSESLPTMSTLNETAIAFYPVSKANSNGEQYGLKFTLDKETTVYLGWIGDLTIADNLEFRAVEIRLLRVLDTEHPYLPNYRFDATAPDKEYIFTTSEVERLSNLSWTASAEDVRYVEGNADGTVVIGDVDFGQGQYVTFFVNSANKNELPSDATFDFYLDDATTPVASAPAVTTDGELTFVRTTTNNLSIEGTHKVSMKLNKQSSNVSTLGFITSSTIDGLKDAQYTPDKHVCYCEGNKIIIKNLDNEKVNVYSVDGKTIYQKEASGTVSIPVSRGIYSIVIGSRVYKIACFQTL